MSKAVTSNFYVNRFKNRRGVDRVQISGNLSDWDAAGLPRDGTQVYPRKNGDMRRSWHGSPKEAEPLVELVEAWEDKLAAEVPPDMRSWIVGPPINGLGRTYILEWLRSMEGNSLKEQTLRTMGLVDTYERGLLWRLLVQDGWVVMKNNRTEIGPHGMEEADACLGMLRLIGQP